MFINQIMRFITTSTWRQRFRDFIEIKIKEQNRRCNTETNFLSQLLTKKELSIRPVCFYCVVQAVVSGNIYNWGYWVHPQTPTTLWPFHFEHKQTRMTLHFFSCMCLQSMQMSVRLWSSRNSGGIRRCVRCLWGLWRCVCLLVRPYFYGLTIWRGQGAFELHQLNKAQSVGQHPPPPRLSSAS